MKKLFTLSMALGLCFAASAQELTILSCGMGEPGRDEPQLMGLGISPDGTYICGPIENGSGYFVADRLTGKVEWDIANGDKGGELRNVDNNGLAIGFTDNGMTFDYNTRQVTFFDVPEGYRGIIGEALTDDGSILVGSLTSQSFTTYGAYAKDGGDWTLLPIPTEEELGALYPRQGGSAAKHVSGDGKVIFGFLGSFSIPIVWTLNDQGEYEYDFFPARFLKAGDADPDASTRKLISLSAMYLSMSNNGRYLAMVGLIESEEGEGGVLSVPCIYDTETKSMKIYRHRQKCDIEGWGLYPSSIADDGTFMGCIAQPYFKSQGTFIWKAGQPEAQTWTSAFPEYKEKLGAAESLGFNMPTDMSADGRYLMGYTFYADDYSSSEGGAYYVTYVIDRGDEVGVREVTAGPSTIEAIYSLDGRRLQELAPGINIVRRSDGSIHKILK